ncbi:MAG TPA: O-antigen ligase family protein [Verrucomicrobiae bacterium]|nr:O-antigen ligase family protein [Verrucomicrobiae bacterium]
MGLHLPPAVATWLTLGFIALLFRREFRVQRSAAGALWLPVIWLFLTGSRAFSDWLNIFGFHVAGAASVQDGSPIDGAVFEVLIALGFYVLYQRRVSLSVIVRNNRWMTVFLVYGLLAILWSDYPFVALKRWIKDLGTPTMVLIVLTEPDPEQAVVRLMKYCAYVWVPISIVFIKYYPQWGRGFDQWTGTGENHGIAGNKNMLGLDLFIIGACLVWYLPKVWSSPKSPERRNELLLMALFGYMIFWLFDMAHSSTSMVSFFIASALMVFLASSRVNPRYIGAYLLGTVIIGVVAEECFGIYSAMVQFLGKSPTLSGRTVIWTQLLHVDINPILGSGYESFWLGEHIKQSFWPGWSFVPNEAHNAYLDTYLNLGLAGLFLLLGWFIVIYLKAHRDLVDGVNWGRFRLAFLVAALFYGWTEAAFRSIDPVYFMIFLIAMDYPRPELAAAAQAAEPEPSEAGMALAGAKARSLMANNQTGIVTN